MWTAALGKKFCKVDAQQAVKFSLPIVMTSSTGIRSESLGRVQLNLRWQRADMESEELILIQ